jgi:hypothetical protein
MFRYLALFAALAVSVSGCAGTRSARLLDVRAALLASAKKGDPDFPDGQRAILTHFSHVGQLATSSGETIYVADRRAVAAGMLAPRGQNYITFFDGRFRYLGRLGYVASRPLWCDGSRLYLFGDLDGFATGLSGNVIDVTGGYEHLRAYHVRAYGSSGGIDD